MSYDMTCPRCGEEFFAPDRDSLADAVVDHARSDHGHHLDRYVVLAHLDGVRPEDFER